LLFTQGTLKSIFSLNFFLSLYYSVLKLFSNKKYSNIFSPKTFKDDCTDKIVLIYIDYALLKTLNCNADVYSVAFDSTYLLASGSSDSTFNLWDKNSGDQLRSLTGHANEVWAVAFDSDNMLASGSSDKTIKLWDKKTGGLLRTITGHGEQVRSVAFDTTHLLASGSWDETVKIWNKNYGDLLWNL
jgi:WD40 repeat protein